MAGLFERGNVDRKSLKSFGTEEHKNSVKLFLLLLAILVTPEIFGTGLLMFAIMLPLVLITIYFSFQWFTKEELSSWMSETWFLVKQITPLLLAGVFFAGIIVEILPAEYVVRYVGGATISSYLIAAVSAALMYFSTLTEVPIISALTLLGMGRGPALSMLLAGPALSLPNMIVISRIMGVRRGLVYILLVVIISAIAGFTFSFLI